MGCQHWGQRAFVPRSLAPPLALVPPLRPPASSLELRRAAREAGPRRRLGVPRLAASIGTVALCRACAWARPARHRRPWRRGGRRRRASRAAAGKAGAGSADLGLSFDSQLVRQFLEIAQPYFLPLEERGASGMPGGGFLFLIAALLIGVVSGTYWLSLGALALGKAVLPASSLPEAVPGLLQGLSLPPLAAAAGLGLAGAGAAFAANRGRLEGRWDRWGLLGLLLFLLFCVTGLNVLLSYVFRAIDNVLVAKDAAAFYQQLTVFGGALVVAVPVISAYRFVRLTLGRRWRKTLTELFLERYMAGRAFYLLDSNSQATDVDNPDQRITEDVEYFTRETLDFLLDILDSVLNLFSFTVILWTTSQSLTGALVMYALLGTTIALVVGGRLIGINYEQLRLQADFRYSLVHVRDNAEAIAFYGGEKREQREVVGKLDAALQNYDRLIVWTTGLSAYQQAFFYLARLVPYFVLGGLYFSGQVDFGTLGQAQFAFSMVLSSVTLIVSRIQDISRFSAGISRLGTFWEALGRCDAEGCSAGPEETAVSRIATTEAPESGALELRGMTLSTPDGSRTLLKDLDVALEGSGPRRLLVVGSSGVGKSSVLRAVAGLWTRGGGEVRRPPAHAMLFLPQRPYMPLGDLRTQLLYPAEGTLGHREDGELREVLGAFGLGDLPDRFPGGFDEVQDWTRVLSLGEQQRLAAARCLTTRPRFVVLDEATSALPLPSERIVYERLAAEPTITGYISVGHRASLAAYHDLVLELLGEGRWRLMSPAEYRETVGSA